MRPQSNRVKITLHKAIICHRLTFNNEQNPCRKASYKWRQHDELLNNSNEIDNEQMNDINDKQKTETSDNN